MHGYYFEKLEVWQDAKNFAVYVYRLTDSFPDSEKFGMIMQLRRASLSISANVAEGMSRSTNPDKARFINQAYSSTIEVLNFLIIAKELSFMTEDEYLFSRNLIEAITNKLNRLYKALKALSPSHEDR